MHLWLVACVWAPSQSFTHGISCQGESSQCPAYTPLPHQEARLEICLYCHVSYMSSSTTLEGCSGPYESYRADPVLHTNTEVYSTARSTACNHECQHLTHLPLHLLLDKRSYPDFSHYGNISCSSCTQMPAWSLSYWTHCLLFRHGTSMCLCKVYSNAAKAFSPVPIWERCCPQRFCICETYLCWFFHSWRRRGDKLVCALPIIYNAPFQCSF